MGTPFDWLGELGSFGGLRGCSDGHGSVVSGACAALTHLWWNYFSAAHHVCRLPGYWRRVSWRGRGSYEHSRPVGLVRVITGVWLFGGSLRQLQRAVYPHGGNAFDR